MEFLRQLEFYAGPFVERVPVGLLVLARVLPAVVLTPFLGGQKIPQRVRTALSLVLTLFLVPLVEPIAPPGRLMLVALLVKEIVIGLVIGFVASLLFHAILSAGRLVDLMRGTNQASMQVPQIEADASPMGQLQFQVALAFFLVVGGHLLFLRGFLESFTALPPGAMFAAGSFPGLLEWMLQRGAGVLRIGLQLAAPAAIALLLTDVTLGVINRFAPQVQVFFLGMPLKAVAGVGMLLITLGLTARLLQEQLAGGFAELAYVVRTFAS